MTAYYNEFDPKAAAWLRELIKQGHIADGVVDERSIEDVRPSDLAGFTQCHFFAGIGGWSLALRQAGVPDSQPVWTGSCPCQPFSAAGKGGGMDDERHLWPAFFHLIEQCGPSVVLGEQVASADGLGWLDLVHADLEGAGYAFGAADLCAAGVGAPHIRQRLYWVAHSSSTRLEGWSRAGCADQRTAGSNGVAHGLAHTSGERRDGQHARLRQGQADHAQAVGGCEADRPAGSVAAQLDGKPDRMADAQQHDRRREAAPTDHFWTQADRPADQHSGCGGAPDRMADAVHAGWAERGASTGQRSTAGSGWLYCRDGKYRPTQPGLQPLAHGLPLGLAAGGSRLAGLAGVAGLDGPSLKRAKQHRLAVLKGAGNAIVPQVAATFIQATGLLT